jgi:hypothetical protein
MVPVGVGAMTDTGGVVETTNASDPYQMTEKGLCAIMLLGQQDSWLTDVGKAVRTGQLSIKRTFLAAVTPAEVTAWMSDATRTLSSSAAMVLVDHVVSIAEQVVDLGGAER